MACRYTRPIHRWPVPPNWSTRDWREEMEAEISAAAWEAERDFDPTRGVPLEVFVRYRVWSRARSRYRREWSYARRLGPDVADGDREGASAGCFDSVDASESLGSCVDRLCEPQRRLIRGLYWEDRTEIELAGMFSLSQSTISKRKRRALDKLRHWIDRLEKTAGRKTEE